MIAAILKFGMHQVRQLFQPRGSLLPEGSRAPDFTAKDESGNTHPLSQLRGRKVVLWFFPRADTPG
jgi:peroxiredoxin